LVGLLRIPLVFVKEGS